MKANLRFLLFCIGASLMILGASDACTPQQRADVVSAAAKDAPCIEACAPLLFDEVLSAKSDDAGAASVLAFSIPAPPRASRVTLHRRCTAWSPVLLDAGADGSSVKADDAIQPPREPPHGSSTALIFDAGKEAAP